jgi:outer membrane protein assembly factor BamB
MHKRNIPVLLIFILLAISLTACSGVPMAAGWPESLTVDKTIYTASSSFILAVNAETGQQIWRYPEKADGARVFAAAPVMLDGDMIVGDYSFQLHSLNPVTGKENWVNKDATGRYIASPTLVDGLILAPNADHSLYAINKNGLLQWKFTAKNGLWDKPVSDGKSIFISSMDKNLYALNPQTGSVVWSVELGGSVLFSQAIGKDGSLYIGTLNNEIISIASDTGKVNWRVPTTGAVWSPVVEKDGTIFAGDQSGKVFALSTKDGSKIWELDAGSPVIGGLALSDKGLYFGTQNGDALEVSTDGQKIWTQTVGGKLYSTPVISGSTIIFGVFEGDKTLAALDENGKLVWSFTPSK